MKREELKRIEKDSLIRLNDDEADMVLELINHKLKNYEFEDDNSYCVPQMTMDVSCLREDVPKDSLTVDDALKNAPSKKYSYFEVKEFVE